MYRKFLFTLLFVFLPCFAIALDGDDFDMSGDDIIIETGGGADNTIFELPDITLNNDMGLVNVSEFDIAGIMLGMSFDDVYNLFADGGLYAPRHKNSIIYTIPQEWRFNLDYECRQQGIVIPAELSKCINSLARSRGLLYASEYHLNRSSTGETIDVYFTSNASDNVVYQIKYKNDIDTLEGANEKFSNQREKKLLSFWQNVLNKYGQPNAGETTWVSSTNKYDPMMTAGPGTLELMDMGIAFSDLVVSEKQSRANFKTKPYAF